MFQSADMSISDYDSDTEENEEFEKPTNDEVMSVYSILGFVIINHSYDHSVLADK